MPLMSSILCCELGPLCLLSPGYHAACALPQFIPDQAMCSVRMLCLFISTYPDKYIRTALTIRSLLVHGCAHVTSNYQTAGLLIKWCDSWRVLLGNTWLKRIFPLFPWVIISSIRPSYCFSTGATAVTMNQNRFLLKTRGLGHDSAAGRLQWKGLLPSISQRNAAASQANLSCTLFVACEIFCFYRASSCMLTVLCQGSSGLFSPHMFFIALCC